MSLNQIPYHQNLQICKLNPDKTLMCDASWRNNTASEPYYQLSTPGEKKKKASPTVLKNSQISEEKLPRDTLLFFTSPSLPFFLPSQVEENEHSKTTLWSWICNKQTF